MTKVYRNSTELTQLGSVPIYMKDMVDACLRGRLNLFLQGDTGSGKTQLARDAMSYFGGKSLFILGRNDMDTRELFQQVDLEKLRTAKSSAEIKSLTDKVDYHLFVVDELPNCVPAVRAQLFNLFDGFVEINGRAYPIGRNYSVGIATGNIGQKFTESSNELGRALKDRMHVTIDVDHFDPSPSDTFEVLAASRNPRVEFDTQETDISDKIIEEYQQLKAREVPFEKLVIADYLVHGLDYCNNGMSKRKMKDRWPNDVVNHSKGSDEALVLPVSRRAAKSIITLSDALDDIVRERTDGKINPDAFESMMQAYKFVAAYSGVLADDAVEANYSGDKYGALDAVILATKTEFDSNKANIKSGLEMASRGEINQKVMDRFSGRWIFMKDLLEHLAKHE